MLEIGGLDVVMRSLDEDQVQLDGFYDDPSGAAVAAPRRPYSKTLCLD